MASKRKSYRGTPEYHRKASSAYSKFAKQYAKRAVASAKAGDCYGAFAQLITAARADEAHGVSRLCATNRSQVIISSSTTFAIGKAKREVFARCLR